MISADISPDGGKIAIWFNYDAYLVAQMKKISGSRFVGKDRGGPFWTVPLELESARTLRGVFGKQLHLEPELEAWGWAQVEKEKELTDLAVAKDADLTYLPALLPQLAATLRDYQRAAVRFGAACDHPLIADQPGLGKTLETIGAIFEAGLWKGAHLVVAPLTSLETVWEYELKRWQPYQVIVAPQGRANRLGTLDAVQEFLKDGDPLWVVINHAMTRYERIPDPDDPSGVAKIEIPQFPQLQQIQWKTIIVDECHKGVLNNPKTLTARGMQHLKAEKRIALSGTPLGGKPINLWGILHWLYPKQFTSKWRWAEQWLVIEEDHWGKKIQGVRKDRKEDFDAHLNPLMLRRKKSDVLKELPPKIHIVHWVDMPTKQHTQYVKFAMDAELRIEDYKLTATGILAEYTRLKQFAIAEQRVEIKPPQGDQELPKIIPFPTEESCKLPWIQQILDELGIWEDWDADAEGEQCVIFSQFSKVIDMVTGWLQRHKVKAEKLTGETTQATRKVLQEHFQAGKYSVLCMTTTAGGTAITLDRASTVIFLDETWNPDDQEQAEDRVHRASRIHQVTVYRIKTKATVEEYIEKMLTSKKNINDQILDLRQKGYRSYG